MSATAKTITLVSIIIIFIIGVVWILSKDDKTFTKQQTKVEYKQETMTLDSLRKMNIDITLWAESKESFEKLHNIKLESVSSRIETFTKDLGSEFSWEAYKKYMEWEVTTMSIFTDFRSETDKFVAIGDYFQDGNKVKFYAQVYKYPTK